MATKKDMPAKNEESLVPFSVIVDGQDRTIFAKDEADLQVRIARLRSPKH